MQRNLLILALIVFGALTAAAVWQHGIQGIFATAMQSLAAGQIFVDLVIALVLVSVWMWHDARAAGRNPWPWIVATLLVGSFGPLVYLLARKSAAEAETEAR